MASVIMDVVRRLVQLIFFFYLSIIAAILRKAISFFPNPNQFISFAKLGDRALSLYYYYCGLLPCTVNLDDQTAVHFWIPMQRKTKKPSLLLIHGFGGNSKWHFRQVGSLYRDFNLYIPDLVFFGDSYSRRSDRTDVFQARCIGEGMKRLGVEQFSVFGISYGGYVAYRMADMYGDIVEKLVIMSCGICLTEEQMMEEMKKVGSRNIVEILVPVRPEDLRILINLTMYRSPFWIPAFLLQDFINAMYTNNRREKMEILQQLIIKGKSNSNLPPLLNQETLILWGDKDRLFPLYIAHQLARHLGQKSKVEIIKDAGHAANVESPYLVNSLIKSFILAS